MKASLCYRVTKAVFLIVNSIFCLLGIAVIAIGLYFKVGKEEYFQLFNQFELEVAAALLIAAGVLALVTSVAGFIGVAWKIEVVLIFYFMLVIVIFAVEVTAGALAFTNRDRIQREIQARLKESMRIQRLRPNWDKLQSEEDCCGVSNYTDWHVVTQNTLALPTSCCRRTTLSCGRDIKNIQTKGCYAKLQEFLTRRDTIEMIGAAGITVGILQIILIVVAIILVVQMRRHRKAKILNYLHESQRSTDKLSVLDST